MGNCSILFIEFRIAMSLQKMYIMTLKVLFTTFTNTSENGSIFSIGLVGGEATVGLYLIEPTIWDIK